MTGVVTEVANFVKIGVRVRDETLVDGSDWEKLGSSACTIVEAMVVLLVHLHWVSADAAPLISVCGHIFWR